MKSEKHIGGIFIRYLLSIALVTLGLLLFGQSVSASTDYTVKQGDTLFSIADRFDVEMGTLTAANPSIGDPYDITAGLEIIIPDENGTTFIVTAYTAGKESTDKEEGDPGYGITASGSSVKENQTIACPASLDFGTKIHIPALGNTYTCEDRGSAITSGYLDVYMEDLDDALAFGRQDLEVQIIE